MESGYPLTADTVRECVIAASSSNAQSVQAGTKQLEQWRYLDNYYPLLQNVYLDPSLPYECRHLVLILLKNGIDKQWHRSGKNPLCPEDKGHVRASLMTGLLNETDSRLSLYTALIIGKVARYDYPASWPGIITTMLVVAASPPSPTALANVLLALHRIVKEYSSHRLPRFRAAFKEMCGDVMGPISQIYVQHMSLWMDAVEAGDADKANYSIQIGITALKILTQVITQDYDSQQSREQIGNLWMMFYNNFCHVIRLYSNPNPSPGWPAMVPLIKKYSFKLSKLHITMAMSQPMTFCRLPNSMDLVRSYWEVITTFGNSYGIGSVEEAQSRASNPDADADADEPLLERLSLTGLRILRAIMKMTFLPVKTFHYRSASASRNAKATPDMIKSSLLTDDFVKEMLDTLVGKYFRYTALDLHEWENSPEEWTVKQDETSDDFLYAVRPCAEKLFTELVNNYRTPVVSMLSVICQNANSENANVFEKDSIYTALGLGAAVAESSFDFGQFLEKVLLKEIQSSSPLNKVLRRRMAILLSQWILVVTSPDVKVLAYQIYSFLLDPADQLNDIVVRITAGRALKAVVDEWEFDASRFEQFTDPILSNLILLIEECEYETQSALLQTVGAIVSRLDMAILPFADNVMSMLWRMAEKYPDQLMTKQAIVLMLGQIVQSTKIHSVKYHVHCFPIIGNTLAPNSLDGAALTEDVLDLWLILLHNTPTPAPPESAPLMELFKFVPALITRADDSLATVCGIAEAYLYFAPLEMISKDNRQAILTAIAEVFKGNRNVWQQKSESKESIRPASQSQLLHLVEIMALEVVRQDGESGTADFISDLVNSGLLNALLSITRASYIASKYVSTVVGTESYDEGKTSEGQGRWVWDTVDGLVVVDVFTIFSRLGLGNASALFDSIVGWGQIVAANPGPGGSRSPAELEKEVKNVEPFDNVSWVLQEWLHTIESQAGMEQRKLMCVSLTSILQTPQWQILDLMGDFMVMWTDVVLQVTEAGIGGEGTSDFHFPLETISEVESPGTIRVRHQRQSDPVRSINLIDTVRSCVSWLIEGMGGSDQFDAKMTELAGKRVLSGLKSALTGGNDNIGAGRI